MSGKPDGIAALSRIATKTVPRIRYIADANADVVQTIERGVLFLMAFWSGSACQAFAALTEVISELNSDDLEFVVVDIDGSPELYQLPNFRGEITGNGETAWIRHGQIISTAGRGSDVGCLRANTLSLLCSP